jgi:hypothetical protein
MTDEELRLEEAKALAILESKLAVADPVVEAARIKTPVESVEDGLAKFARDSFEIVRDDYLFHRDLQDEVRKRLDRFTESQLIALLSNDSVSLNDRVSKVMAPSMSLITTKQQAEIAAKAQIEKVTGDSANPSTMRALNEQVTADVLNGAKALTDVLTMMMTQARQQVPPPDPINVTPAIEE